MSPSSEPNPPTPPEAGFVQLAVLGGLAILAALMTAAMITAISGSRAAAALEERIIDDAATRGGIARLLAAIADPSDRLELDAMAQVARIEWPGRLVHLAIESEESKINLLLAEPDQLLRYAGNAGLPAASVESLGRSLLAARDRGDGGAAFEAMADSLHGMRSRQHLLEDLTIYSAVTTIDPAYASASVLASIPDITPTELALLLQTPAAERANRVPSRYFASSSRRFTLSATSVDPAGHQYQQRMVIELSSTGAPLPLSGLF